MSRTDEATKVPHPAKFTPEIVAEMAAILHTELDRSDTPLVKRLRLVDPFAGTGRIFDLQAFVGPQLGITAVELEKEWADYHRLTRVGDCFDLLPKLVAAGGAFDVLATSPVYPNRMTDHHDAKDASKRSGYRFQLGRMPTKGSAAILGWGPDYRDFHRRFVDLAVDSVMTDGLIMINMSNHLIEKGTVEVRVNEFWINTLIARGCRIQEVRRVRTPRNGFGANGEYRVDGEVVIAARTPQTRTML